MISRLRFSRRQTLVGGLALAAMGTGTAYVGSSDANDFFRAMVHHELPGVKVNDATIRAFTEDATSGLSPRNRATVRVLSMRCRIVGYGAISAALGQSFKFQRFRREMLTRFLLATDFFQLPDPKAAELHYVGEPIACGNPFAKFAHD
jgi:hypothetical protein